MFEKGLIAFEAQFIRPIAYMVWLNRTYISQLAACGIIDLDTGDLRALIREKCLRSASQRIETSLNDAVSRRY